MSRVERSGNGRNGRLVPIGTNHPLPHAFYEGDSYVMQYSVRAGRKPDVIYFWQVGCKPDRPLIYRKLSLGVKEQSVGEGSKRYLNCRFG